MKLPRIIHWFYVTLLTLLCHMALVLNSAESLPPMPRDYVTDMAGVLNVEARKLLNDMCVQWDTPQGGQLLVYIDTTLPPNEDIESYSHKLFRHWKPGSKSSNRGVLFTVFTQSRKMRIQTGYGLEAQLPDVTCKRILDRKVKPHLKMNRWELGISSGIQAIQLHATLKTAETPATGPQSRSNSTELDDTTTAISLVIIVVLATALVVIRVTINKRNQLSKETEERLTREAEEMRKARLRIDAARQAMSYSQRVAASKPRPYKSPGVAKAVIAGATVGVAASAAAASAAAKTKAQEEEIERRRRKRKEEEEEEEDARRRSSSFSSHASDSSSSSFSSGGGDSGGGGASSDF